MTIKLSPKAVRLAVYRAVNDAVNDAVYRAVENASYWAVAEAVDGPGWRAVRRAAGRFVRKRPPHPNLDRILAEVRQTQGGAP